MKRQTANNLIAYGSLMLNAFFIAIGVYAYERYPIAAAREEKFKFYYDMSIPIVALVLVLFTIFSLIILVRKPTFPPKILACLQLLFMLYYLWGIL